MPVINHSPHYYQQARTPLLSASVHPTLVRSTELTPLGWHALTLLFIIALLAVCFVSAGAHQRKLGGVLLRHRSWQDRSAASLCTAASPGQKPLRVGGIVHNEQCAVQLQHPHIAIHCQRDYPCWACYGQAMPS